MAKNSKRGFAAMDPAKQRKIASKGGKSRSGSKNRSQGSSARSNNLSTEDLRSGGDSSYL